MAPTGGCQAPSQGVSCSALLCAGGDRPAKTELGIEGVKSGGGRLDCRDKPVEDDDELEDEEEAF